jgi:hypothetical protein
VFLKRVLREICGPRRDVLTAGSRRPHNEKLHDFYSSLCIIRIIKFRRTKRRGQVGRMEDKRKVKRLLVRKTEGNSALGRPRQRRVYNIKRDLVEIGLDGVDWIGLAQDRHKWRVLVHAIVKFLVP